jgi:hypothetical protein
VVEDEGKALLRLITLGDAASKRIEVLSGLEAGEKIVIAPTPALREGVLIAESRR